MRQLYYQFVARACFPADWFSEKKDTFNCQENYSKLGTIINKGRLAGLIDWDAIKDRTRAMKKNSHWDNPEDIIDACARSFALDTRANQDVYLEVWVEKEALAGVIERVANELDIPWFACRGYVSQSAMYEAAQRCSRKGGKRVVILHLGDHDPSGVDMTRDNFDRLEMFGVDVKMQRLALNMEQIQKYNPPPNPAKLTDSRCADYIDKYGDQSWELDALDPNRLAKIIRDAADEHTDHVKRLAIINEQKKHRALLREASQRWGEIVDLLE